MVKTFVGVRDVDEDIFRKFRAMSIEEKIRLGDALTKAMRILLEERKKREKTITQRLKVKPLDWGAGTERTSTEIDKLIY